jgi:hypothetical protein
MPLKKELDVASETLLIQQASGGSTARWFVALRSAAPEHPPAPNPPAM